MRRGRRTTGVERAPAPATGAGKSRDARLPAWAAFAILSLAATAFAPAQASAEDLTLPALTPAPFAAAPDAGYWTFWTQPHLLGDWGGHRTQLEQLGVSFNIVGVDEAVGNVTGGTQRTVQEAGQVGLQAKADLQKLIGLTGATFEMTLVQRWGDNLATSAGIPALMLLNEVYGRGNILRLEEFAYRQKLFGDRLELTVGRLAFGDEFLSFSCDFINLTFCGAPPGNIVGDYVYNWPISQWAAVGKLNLTPEIVLKAGVFDSNPQYLSTKPVPAILPSFPENSQGMIVPTEVRWKPHFGALLGDYTIGGWWNNSAAPNVTESLNGEPILVSGLPALPGHGRYGFSALLQQMLVHDASNSDPKNGLYAFFNATFADRRTANQDAQIAFGLFQQGVGSRPRDGWGVAVGGTQVNPNVANAQAVANALGVGPGYVQHIEYATEAWYGWQATGWLNLKFDAQYVICPGGYTQPDNRNAFVLGVRTTVDF